MDGAGQARIAGQEQFLRAQRADPLQGGGQHDAADAAAPEARGHRHFRQFEDAGMLLDQGDTADGCAVEAGDQHLAAAVDNGLRVVEGDEVGGLDREEGLDPFEIEVLEGNPIGRRGHGGDDDRVGFGGAGVLWLDHRGLLGHHESMSEVEP